MAGDPEKNKRLLREQRAASQMKSLPSGLPGEDGPFEAPNPLIGYTPRSVITACDAPGSDPSQFMKMAAGFPSQALGPTVISYGPMMAEGDLVFEEWESLIYGENGTLYNNQYTWILKYENDTVVEMREYNDSHHAYITFGP